MITKSYSKSPASNPASYLNGPKNLARILDPFSLLKNVPPIKHASRLDTIKKTSTCNGSVLALKTFAERQG